MWDVQLMSVFGADKLWVALICAVDRSAGRNEHLGMNKDCEAAEPIIQQSPTNSWALFHRRLRRRDYVCAGTLFGT